MTRLTVSGHALDVTVCDGNESRMLRVCADGQPLGVLVHNLVDWQPVPCFRWGRVPQAHCPTQRAALETLIAETIDHQETK